MSTARREYLNPSDRTLAADIMLREETDDDEEEDGDDGNEDGDEDNTDDGCSE